FALLDMRALDLLGGLVALRGLYAVADPAHVNLGGRRALAGVEALGVEHDVELAVEIDDVALAERRGDDSHVNSSVSLSGLAAAGRDVGAQHTDIAPICQRFRAADLGWRGKAL